MTVLLTAVAFVVLLTLLILIHEYGHFWAARKAGVVVEEFGFGLPPKARTLFTHHGTRFTLNWVPFGGFVRLKGENATTQAEHYAEGSFGRASIFSRMMILIAGVFMNFVLAIALLTFGFSAGRWIPTYFNLDDMKRHADSGAISLELGVLIQEVVSGGSAAKAGVPVQSVLLSVDGVRVTEADQVGPLQEGKKKISYTVLSGTGAAAFEETYKFPLQDGKTGVALYTIPRHLAAPLRNPWTGFTLSLREARIMTEQTIVGIGALFSSLAHSGRVPEGITGIVGIAQLTYTSVQSGFMTYLRLVALISLSLAILNFLPFPALDGGRLLFVFVEALVRRPLNRRFEAMMNAFGFFTLIALIILITFYDIARLF